MNAHLAVHLQAEQSDALIGLPALMRMALNGGDLAALAANLRKQAQARPDAADTLMDLATVLQLQWQPVAALKIQSQALALQQIYHQPATQPVAVKLLAIMGAGDLMANAPLQFLVEDSDIALDMLYLAPDQALPANLPDHDVLFIAVSECDQNRALLKHIASLIKTWPRPVLNKADRIGLLSRDSVCNLLRTKPGLVAPPSLRCDRQTLKEISLGTRTIESLLQDCFFPIIVRPIDSHAGRGLSKLDSAKDLALYLHTRTEEEFYVSHFVDYRDADGRFRKYRVALIDGHGYACHMGISDHWMIHYLNAGMMHSAEKRREEADFMAHFDEDFGLRHATALRTISECMALDYLVLDCAETAAGDLLIFEADTSAVVHAMDSVDIFPYKPAQMRKVFAAFRDLLLHAIQRGSAL